MNNPATPSRNIVLPALSGYRGAFYRDNDGKPYYEIGDVIAWRIFPSGFIQPIVLGAPCDEEDEADHIVISPGGEVVGWEGTRYESVDDWFKARQVVCADRRGG